MANENDTSSRKLQDVFLEAWDTYEFIDETTIDTNGVEYQVTLNNESFYYSKTEEILIFLGFFFF